MSHCPIPGGWLHYELDETAGREAPVLVVSNSLAAEIGMWDGQMPLLRSRYRVLRYDTRGHGRSTTPPGPWTFDDLLADVVALLDQLDIARADFLGLSLGGMTGLGLAIHYPERISRLVCCSARAVATPAFIDGWNTRISQVQAGGMISIVDATLERWLVPAFRQTHPLETAALAAAIGATSLDGYIAAAGALKSLNFFKDFEKIQTPTLFVVGSEDIAAPPQAMQEMANALTGSVFKIVQNAAHLPNIDNAEDFAKAISSFLGLQAPAISKTRA